MKLHEAIETLMLPENYEQWTRPISWRGCQQAFCLSSDKQDVQIVPGNGGGRSYMSCSVSVLTGEWEIVSPDIVLDGE